MNYIAKSLYSTGVRSSGLLTNTMLKSTMVSSATSSYRSFTTYNNNNNTKTQLTTGNSNSSSIEQKRWYHERVLDHYNNPRNVGSFDKNLPDVGTATVGAPACGDVMKIQIKVKDNVIVDVCFKTFGCGSAIASSSLATQWVKGKTLEECLEIKNTDIAKHLSLPPVKMHCSMLAEQAIKRAIYDYKLKLDKQKESGIAAEKEKVLETSL